MRPSRQAPGEQDLSSEGPRAGQATPGDRSKELGARVARVSTARSSWRTETNLHLGRPSPETILSLRGGGPRGKEGEAGRGRGGGRQADRHGRKERAVSRKHRESCRAGPRSQLAGFASQLSRDPRTWKQREGGGARRKASLCAVASVRAIWGKRLERRWRRRHWLCRLKDLLYSCSLKCPVEVVRSSGVWAPTGYPVGCMCGGGGRSELGLLRKTTGRTAFS